MSRIEPWTSAATLMAVVGVLTTGADDVGRQTVGATAATSPRASWVAAALQPGKLRIDPPDAYAQYCSVCHGESARGDGMAAVAFNPKPRDLSDPDFWAQRSDAQIDSVIVRGTGVMPPLGEILDRETREALVDYLRQRYADGRASSGRPSEP